MTLLTRRILLGLVMLVPALPIGSATGRQIIDLANRIAATREETGVPALAALVMVDGEVRATAAIGERAKGSGVPVTEKDRWHLGSVTKSMTATLVARLVERGVVSWDDTVGVVLGDSIPDMRAAYRSANLRHLLSHRAGLKKGVGKSLRGEFGQNPADPIADRREWARLALSRKPVGPLEKTFKYSNAGYVIAAAMLEARTGKTWERLIADEVFAPLGLGSAGFGPPGTQDAYDEPRGHRRKSGEYRAVGLEVDNPAAMGPAGRVHMTLDDLVRYADTHRRRDPNYLSAESFEILHTPPYGGNYAMGWVLRSDGRLSHVGSNELWYVVASFWPEGKTAGAVAANAGEIAELRRPLGQLLYDLVRAARENRLVNRR